MCRWGDSLNEQITDDDPSYIRSPTLKNRENEGRYRSQRSDPCPDITYESFMNNLITYLLVFNILRKWKVDCSTVTFTIHTFGHTREPILPSAPSP